MLHSSRWALLNTTGCLALLCLTVPSLLAGEVRGEGSGIKAAAQDDPGYLTALARVHLRYGHIKEALKILKEAEKNCTKDPDKAEVYDALAMAYAANGQRKESLDYVTKEIALTKDPARRRHLLPQIIPLLIQAKDYQLAEEYCAEMQNSREENVRSQVTRLLLDLHKAKGDLDDFLGAVEGKLKASPRDIGSLALLAEAYQGDITGKREPARAAAFLEVLLAISPDNSSYAYRLADSYVKSGQPEKAAGVYERLVARSPNRNVYFIKRIVELYADAGKKDVALEWVGKLDEGPPNFYSLRDKAHLYGRLGLGPKALGAMEEALRIAEGPDQKLEARFEIANMRISRKEYDKAEEMLRVIVDDRSTPQAGLAQAKRVLADVLGKAEELDETDLAKPSRGERE